MNSLIHQLFLQKKQEIIPLQEYLKMSDNYNNLLHKSIFKVYEQPILF